jgi:hypothetical protein
MIRFETLSRVVETAIDWRIAIVLFYAKMRESQIWSIIHARYKMLATNAETEGVVK